jgi:hypothetical protein
MVCRMRGAALMEIAARYLPFFRSDSHQYRLEY